MRQLAIAIGLQILQGLAQSIWDSFWDEIFEAVVYAESEWAKGGGGQTKKLYVVQRMMDWLECKGLAKWYKRRFMHRAVETIVDRIIEEANRKAGHNWVDHAEELQNYLASKIPFIK